MPQASAWLNGRFIPACEASVPVYDAGFVMGVTVAEQLRTFRGELFRLDQHLDRLAHSLEIVGVDPGFSRDQIAAAARELAARNHRLGDAGDDLGLSMFATPGAYATMSSLAASAGNLEPTVCLHSYPLPFHLWCHLYESGQPLAVTRIRQVPADCWPPELKCRSRMHYYLADQQARRIDPRARALLLDHRDRVLEASTANILIYRRDEGLISPPVESILPGISVRVIEELSETLGLRFLHRDLTVDELYSADEVLLCSTSPCVWPVLRLNDRPLGAGRPGEVCRELLAAWSRLVGVDIPAQARQSLQRARQASNSSA